MVLGLYSKKSRGHNTRVARRKNEARHRLHRVAGFDEESNGKHTPKVPAESSPPVILAMTPRSLMARTPKLISRQEQRMRGASGDSALISPEGGCGGWSPPPMPPQGGQRPPEVLRTVVTTTILERICFWCGRYDYSPHPEGHEPKWVRDPISERIETDPFVGTPFPIGKETKRKHR